ncbi:TPA: ribonucleotide-diphosphate reductase subunit alpha [Candidatus Collierbacteria bacterium]|nr:ribonucleotide-diphosphate reductase subunit alpha [Candidatus Collierbacteria bacterium]HAN22164.1 ribonucleotide-diphosphate reductase subunit alpha [Candidatus Collierbacteria bacterium]HAS69290.1 ribonucleotide-diphosphate reductase subunit alpha [Candidatus Collierbacteria bacterium]HCW31827.1 ribonucleotide-diphosphate reductase subunit alpha [Candidatus Collierbacteria bacterium]
MPKDLAPGDWSEQGIKVLKERYLDKNSEGEIIETPDELVWRVAFIIASAEARFGASIEEITETAKSFYKLMGSRKFLPNSPTLMNAGKNNGLQYSGCFVLPVPDSLEGIFDAIKYQAIIHQSGGGTGFSFSRLRQRGSMVKRSRGVASGPISFMRVFNEATQQIKQGGTRRGANMGILRVDHPDVREFITCKLDGGLANFNISVAATDKFMKALAKGEKYDLVEPHSGEVIGQEDAREIFDLICDCAWRSGDPGMIFIDRVNAGPANPVPSLGPVESTNPCGEQPLYPFDACNLGSIFLNYFVKEEKGKQQVDWEELKKTAGEAVRFLDDVIEINPYPLKQVWDTVRSIRRVGLGIGGWADMLYLLGVPYNSEEALKLAEKVMKTINDAAHESSQELAKVRGAFPLFKESIYKDGEPMRNAAITTIAPTGTIGIIANTSGGCEPVFALAYKHMVKDESLNREMFFSDPAFTEVAKREGFWSEELMSRVAETGSVHGVAEVPEEWQKILVTAHEISPEWHVRMQAAWQKNLDNAVSKTINLPNEAVVDDVAKAYLSAYELGCMGITIYRDGCKEWQVLNVGTKKEEKKVEGVIEAAEMRIRPSKLQGNTYKVQTPVGTAFVVINADESGNPFEVFINVGKAGSHVMADAEAMGRLISLSLRVPSTYPAKAVAEAIVDQLSGIGGADSVGFGNNRVRSLADGVAKVLREYVRLDGNMSENVIEEEPELLATQQELPLRVKRGDLCPECGQASLVLEEGCQKCYSCGASKC